jgi:hypothetical protein
MSPLGMRQGNASRTTTPFSALRNQAFSPFIGANGFPPSRGPTPFSQIRQPVSNDEETEIAVLAEVEREIYLGMEALEDAFEGLHRKAEMVRRALRERGAGLSMSLESRRTGQPDIISTTTPGPSCAGLGPGYERPNWADGSEMASESDWEPGDDIASELAPDDSASNISSARHRRPKRRNERRTPALVEEEDEDDWVIFETMWKACLVDIEGWLWLLYDSHDDRTGPELFERTYMNEQTCGTWERVVRLVRGIWGIYQSVASRLKCVAPFALLEFMLHSDGCLTGLPFLTLYSSRNQLNEGVTDK